MNLLSKLAFVIPIFFAYLQTQAAETNGLFYISSGQKVDIQINKARVYSQDNTNSEFAVRLDTSIAVDAFAHPVKLRIGGHDYTYSGWGSGPGNCSLSFTINRQDDAEAAAKLFSTMCRLRSPPDYKMLAQFVPSKNSFSTNEPVIVTFHLKNLDHRTILFRSNFTDSKRLQYGFQATLDGHPVSYVGPRGWSGDILSDPVSLAPDEAFEDPLDLKKWFNFDKAGEYTVHGFCRLDFYKPPIRDETFQPWNELCSDSASADFTIVIK